MTDAPRVPAEQRVHIMSVAAEMSGAGVQTLRLYERRNLVRPARTHTGARRYGDDDIARIRRITDLVQTGINLVAVDRILALEDEIAALKQQLSR